MKDLTVLVAEDEKNLLDLIIRILKKEGYETLSASEGGTALRLIHDCKVDILLTDLKMPGIDGLELLKRTKEMDPAIEVILMTAYATLDTAVNALRSGARDYILKPFDIDEVVQSVNKAALLAERAGTEEDTAGNTAENALVANSPVMQELLRMIRKVSASNATILIQGETGVGKELVAKAIHESSSRKDKPFIKVNCSALPETLLESELFGYEKGAFTGAYAQKPGRFELASGGTLFLDEIGDISPLIQVKLLRVLQHKEFERLGGTVTIPADVRIITATNKDLEKLAAEGNFREDLFYRLNVIPITVPPLRERREDIEDLISTMITRMTPSSHASRKRFSPDALRMMLNYNWPGNVRELENIIERVLVISEDRIIHWTELPDRLGTGGISVPEKPLDAAVDHAEEAAIRKTLADTGHNITQAAERLGISRRSLHRKINKYKIHPDKK